MGNSLEDKTNSSLAVTYHWFFTDIIGASDPSLSVTDQANKIRTLYKFIEQINAFKENTGSMITLSTGDGMFIGFKDHPELPIILAKQLHELLFIFNRSASENEKINIRIGMDSGPVYFIEDLQKKPSPWGPGIITARRVMDLCEKMHILATDTIADAVRKLSSDYNAILHPIGNYEIKHGEWIFIYNIYGEGFGNKENPPTPDKPSHRFHFTKMELKTEITDQKTMMAHHTWLWELVNVTPEPVDKVFYFLDGDEPRKFPDLHFKVTDEQGNNLGLVALNDIEGRRKEIIVKTHTPLMPNQRGRSLKLEYDWEEPKKNFYFKLSSNCKNFKYVFTISDEAKIRPRVLEVHSDLGSKEFASIPHSLNYHDGLVEMTWNATNLKAFEEYEFQW